VRRKLCAEAATSLLRVSHPRDERLQRLSPSRVGGMTTPSAAFASGPARAGSVANIGMVRA
jgi:hypothetical protein